MVTIPVPGSSNREFTGSGFYLQFSNKCLFVTAKHVILDVNVTSLPLKNTNATLYCLTLGPDADRRCIINLDLGCLRGKGFIRPHPRRDIIAIYLGTKDGSNVVHFNTGISVVKGGAGPPVWDTAKSCQLADNVLEGDDALILGFPTELLDGGSREVDFHLPLIRRGMISQKNGTTGKLIIDSGVFGGNSGGPLVINERISASRGEDKIAGIMVQFVPAATRVFADVGVTNSVLVYSGYSVSEPIDGALEIIRQFK